MSHEVKLAAAAQHRHWSIRHALGFGALLLVMGGFCVACAIGGPVAAPPRPQIARSAPQAPVRLYSYARNPHLHLPVHEIHPIPQVHLLHTWHRRWEYHTLVASHRGLGMIQGIVHDSYGRPIASAHVELKQSNGHSFHRHAQRHKTHTDSNGAFVMVGVRRGHYRVYAYKSKSKGHVKLSVHTGTVATTQIKI